MGKLLLFSFNAPQTVVHIGLENIAWEIAARQISHNRDSYIRKCTAEAIRLRVQSIEIRFAASNLAMETSTGNVVEVSKGSILAICPFLLHHDDLLFPPQAKSFAPDRKAAVVGDGCAVVPSERPLTCSSM